MLHFSKRLGQTHGPTMKNESTSKANAAPSQTHLSTSSGGPPEMIFSGLRSFIHCGLPQLYLSAALAASEEIQQREGVVADDGTSAVQVPGSPRGPSRLSERYAKPLESPAVGLTTLTL